MRYLLDKSISQFQHLDAENCIVNIGEPFSDFARRLANEVQISKNGLNVFEFAARCQEFDKKTNILQDVQLNTKPSLLSPSQWIEMLESAELFRCGFPVGHLREAKLYGLEWVKLARQYLDDAEIEAKIGWDLTSSRYEVKNESDDDDDDEEHYDFAQVIRQNSPLHEQLAFIRDFSEELEQISTVIEAIRPVGWS